MRWPSGPERRSPVHEKLTKNCTEGLRDERYQQDANCGVSGGQCEWDKRQARPFFPLYLLLVSRRSEASWLTACRLGPAAACAGPREASGYILMYEQEEFVELFDRAATATARLCWRVAQKLAPPGPVAVAEKPTGMNVVLTASPSIGNVTGQTINVPVTVNVMPTEATANAQNAPTKPKEGAGRRQLGQEQRALTAIFGKPPEFGGKTDLEVLNMVNGC